MTRKSLSQAGLQLLVAVILAFPLTFFLNLFEMKTRIPVEGFSRAMVIAVVCGWLPGLFFHFYEVRRRA